MPRHDVPGPAERRRLERLLALPPERAAPGLLGHVLVRRVGRRTLAVRIVETEAYLGEADPDAHASHGKTPRTAPLWGPPGTLYVYLVYGMYHCLNFSVAPEDVPGGVLIRAAEPLPGTPLEPRACSGPGRLCRALGIDRTLTGRHVFAPRTLLSLREGAPPARIGTSGRIGVRHAAERLLRFFDAGSPSVSSLKGRPGSGRPSGLG